MEKMELQECIVFLLAKTSQAGYRFWGSYISEMNVTTVQAMVLILLNRKEGVTSKELGDQTQLDSATMTGLLDRLSALGLIEKRQNPKDRRTILVYLTKEGREKAERLDVLFDRAHDEFVSCLTLQESETLRENLKRILDFHATGKNLKKDLIIG